MIDDRVEVIVARQGRRFYGADVDDSGEDSRIAGAALITNGNSALSREQRGIAGVQGRAADVDSMCGRGTAMIAQFCKQGIDRAAAGAADQVSVGVGCLGFQKPRTRFVANQTEDGRQ